MRGTALALLALAATAQEARSVPTRFLEGALGSPAVRPLPSPRTRSRDISFPTTVARSETHGASPNLTLCCVSSDRQAAHDSASTSSKHDLYAHMLSRTTKVGEGSVSAEEIAAKALQVMERLARSEVEREASGHAPPDVDDELTESPDDEDDDDDDVSLGTGGASSDAASIPSAPYHFDPEATTEWTDPWDEETLEDDEHYGDDYEYADVDEARLGRAFDPEPPLANDVQSRGGDARVWFGDAAASNPARRASASAFGAARRARQEGDVGYPLAALGDAASETLRELGADPRASPRRRTDVAALGGARKPGSDVFLDDFTRSFEDQLGADLDAAEAKRAEKARRRRAKAEKAEARKAEAQKAEARKAETQKAEAAARAAKAEAEAEADAKARSAAAPGRLRTKSSQTSESRKPFEAKVAKATSSAKSSAKSSTHASSKLSRRRAKAPREAKAADVDDAFDGIARADIEAAPAEPETEPQPARAAGEYGDSEAMPEAKRRASRKKSTTRSAGVRDEGLGSPDSRRSEPTATDSENDSLGEDATFSGATSRKGDAADGNSRSRRAVSPVSTSLRDPETRVAVDSADGSFDAFTFRDLEFDDVPGARTYVDGGREYFNELYEKGADWVNAEYETAADTTQLWVDEFEESGRSKKRLRVDVFLDAADPYSLELVLGPIQNLLRMDLGPLAWTFHAHSNVGQNRGRRTNCGGEIAGSAARVSCVANAAVQCSQRAFQNMTSGLGRFEKRAEEIRARRERMTRAKAEAALGATVSGREGKARVVVEASKHVHASAVRARGRGRGVLSVSDDYAPGARAGAGDHAEQDTLADLFEPDDAATPEDSNGASGVNVSSSDAPAAPSFVDGVGGDSDARDGLDGADRFDDTAAPLNVFLACLSTKLLEMESGSGSAFGDSNREAALLSMSATCCETAVGGASVDERQTTGLLATCREQATCLSTDRGFEALSAASNELEALTPKYKWLPWVLVEQKPVCVHSCNLQQGIRRAVCNNREGTLPSDCPRFPWSKIWYDEPEVSFAGVAGVGFGLLLVIFSMALLAQQAGCCARRKRRDDEARGEAGETSPLLGLDDEK